MELAAQGHARGIVITPRILFSVQEGNQGIALLFGFKNRSEEPELNWENFSSKSVPSSASDLALLGVTVIDVAILEDRGPACIFQNISCIAGYMQTNVTLKDKSITRCHSHSL